MREDAPPEPVIGVNADMEVPTVSDLFARETAVVTGGTAGVTDTEEEATESPALFTAFKVIE